MIRGTIILGLLAAAIVAAGELEDWIEAADDPEAIQEWLDELRANPLNVNAATVAQLAGLPLVDAATAYRIVAERERNGAFASPEDFAKRTTLSTPVREIFESLTRIESIAARGGKARVRIVAGGRERSVAGSGQRWWSSTRTDLRAESGPRGYLWATHRRGEPDIVSDVAVGFEVPQSGLRPRLAVGMLQLEAGTGLVFGSAWGLGAWLASPYRGDPGKARGLSVRPAADHLSAIQGAALAHASTHMNLVVFAGRTRLDAAESEAGIERITEGESAPPELATARNDRVGEELWAAVIEGHRNKLAAGATYSRARYSPELYGTQPDATELRFGGSLLQTGSLYARGQTGPLSATAEFAVSEPGGAARQIAATAAGESTTLTVFHSAAAADYYAPRARQWGGRGVEARNRRVTGFRAIVVRPGQRAALTGSLTRTPFRTASSPLMHHAADVEARWAWNLAADAEVELLAGRRWRETPYAEAPAMERRIDRARLEITWRSAAEYRIRYEVRSAIRADRADRAQGSLLFAQAKAPTPLLDVFGRVTAFHLEHDDVSIDLYEQAPLGAYPLVPLHGTGIRAALLLARRAGRIGGAIKAAHTRFDSGSASQGFWEFAVQMSITR